MVSVTSVYVKPFNGIGNFSKWLVGLKHFLRDTGCLKLWIGLNHLMKRNRRRNIALKMEETNHGRGVYIQEFFVTFEGILIELKQARGKLTEDEVTVQLLSAMPASFQSVERRIKHAELNVSDQPSHQRKGILEISGWEEIPNKFQDSIKKTQVPEFNGKCYNCGGRGHKRYQCPSARLFSEHKASTTQDADEHCDIAFLANVNNSKECCHLAKHLFSTCKGKIHLQSWEGINITLINIMLSDQLSLNLLSVKKMEEGR
ncbi:hypothetical protein PR048_007775, partial [Dryococelus australis]